MKKINYLSFIVFLMALSANLVARADTAAEIEAVNATIVKDFKAGKIADMTSLYTKDAVMLPPSSEILSSPAAISKYWSDLKDVGVKEYSLYLVDLKVDGNVAYATSLWEASRKVAGNDDITMDGNVSSVFEKQKDGSWKIKLQSWN